MVVRGNGGAPTNVVEPMIVVEVTVAGRREIVAK